MEISGTFACAARRDARGARCSLQRAERIVDARRSRFSERIALAYDVQTRFEKIVPEEKFLWKTCCINRKNMYNYCSDIFP